MYQLSNSWWRLENSKCRLVALKIESFSKIKLGFAKWEDFYPHNDFEKLYYLEANFEKLTVTFLHKNNPNFDCKPVLRNSL